MDREISKKERQRTVLRKRLPYIIGGLVVIGLVVFASGMMRKSIKERDLTISQVEIGNIQITFSASGKIVPAFEEVINSPIRSRIMEVYCKAGDSVGAGTPLLRLDLESAETKLTQLQDEIAMKQYEHQQQTLNAETQLTNLEMRIDVKEMEVSRLEAELKNERYLDSLGSGTGDRVREAELAYKTGMLELAQMRKQLDNERRVAAAGDQVKALDMNIANKNLGEMVRTLDDAKIKSPRTATLTYICNQIGQQIEAGEKIAVISDLSHFKLDGEIADAYGDRIAIGSKAIVKIGRDTIPGTVINLTPLSRGGVIDFSVQFEQDNHPRLRSGVRADVYVLGDVCEEVMRIRNGSYYTGPGDYSMFVVNGDNELARKAVRLGQSNYEYVEVVSGLNLGDKVVVNDMNDFQQVNKIKITK